jgi:4'-phosphopantetheinyl transferase
MWALPPRRLHLGNESLHIWRVSLAARAGERAGTRAGLEDILSAEEKDQCSRFVRPEDRARCAASRAALRVVLAKYTGTDPRALALTAGTSGKPCLDCPQPSVQFNMAHSGDLALIAVTRESRVGIDIERKREIPGMESILDAFFSRQESIFLRSLGPGERRLAFFQLWTRREAAAKALGIGLYDCFSRVVLPAVDRSRSWFKVELPESDAPAGPAHGWWMRDMGPARGYAGAVCTEQEDAKLSFWRLRPAT